MHLVFLKVIAKKRGLKAKNGEIMRLAGLQKISPLSEADSLFESERSHNVIIYTISVVCF